MMRLKRGNEILVPDLVEARSLWSRTKGLLGRDSLDANEALWIHRCNSVHTFFMRFAIDLVFVNREMVVTKVIPQVKPGKLVLPIWSASSVFELPAGFLNERPIKVGEKLDVDSSLS